LAVSAVKLAALLLVLTAAALRAQPAPVIAAAPISTAPQPQIDFTCPMHPEVRSKTPGKCPRCGMTLEARIPEPVEYRVDIAFEPKQIPAGRSVSLTFRVRDPKTGAPVTDFQIVHEKYIHFFIVSADLEYFSHEHPVLGPDSIFRHTTTFPKPGTYKLIVDFYPTGATPQLISKIISTAGYRRALTDAWTTPPADLQPKTSENLEISLTTEPAQPIAGKKTLLFFHLKPTDGNDAPVIEPYLGAWSHMLIASNDLIDAIHDHPTIADGGPQAQFDIFFPREAVYRIWVQFQRHGKVNTVPFTLPVSALK
jgi:hypothetical protein